MNPLTIGQIRRAVDGEIVPASVEAGRVVGSICTDSRKLTAGCLFIALRGENFDAHQFLPQVAAAGARAALVDAVPPAIPDDFALIRVPDTRKAMGRLAHFIRQDFAGKVIAVAGSNGKTSTKHLIHAALHGRLRGSISPKSFNNDIGVPLAIFPADPADDYLVLEMGTNHHGEIRPLSEMAQPDIAVITNCGAEHLEGLGDLAGVRRENAQVTCGLKRDGLLIVNGDEPLLLAEVRRLWPGAIQTFGFSASNDLVARDVVCEEAGVEFSVSGSAARVRVPMLGHHAAANALAAIAVARSMRLPDEAIFASLAQSDGPQWRLQLQKTPDVTILNDAYNANPNSMKAAIETLAALPAGGRRVAILGDMRELGDHADDYHRQIGRQVADAAKVDLLLCVGIAARSIAAAAEGAGFGKEKIRRFDSAAQAADAAPRLIQRGDLILIKASRGIQLEQVASAIANGRLAPT